MFTILKHKICKKKNLTIKQVQGVETVGNIKTVKEIQKKYFFSSSFNN